MQNRPTNLTYAVTREGHLARGHLVENRPKREQICACVQFPGLHLLGRHVRHSAQHGARAGQVRFGFSVAGGDPGCDFCQTEIENLRMPAPRDEDVGRLDVAMHDALAVRCVEPVGNVNGNAEQVFGFERPAQDQCASGLRRQGTPSP